MRMIESAGADMCRRSARLLATGSGGVHRMSSHRSGRRADSRNAERPPPRAARGDVRSPMRDHFDAALVRHRTFSRVGGGLPILFVSAGTRSRVVRYSFPRAPHRAPCCRGQRARTVSGSSRTSDRRSLSLVFWGRSRSLRACCLSCTSSQAVLLCTHIESGQMRKCTTLGHSRENRARLGATLRRDTSSKRMLDTSRLPSRELRVVDYSCPTRSQRPESVQPCFNIKPPKPPRSHANASRSKNYDRSNFCPCTIRAGRHGRELAYPPAG